MKIFRCSSTQRYSMQDYESLIRLFRLGSKRMGLKTISLGYPCGYPMFLSTPSNPNPNLKNLLVVAGIHGEETAGPWATIRFLLSENPELSSMINISILPVFNPSVFSNKLRTNIKKERTNVLIGDVSEEGKIIKRYSNMLAKLGSDCILSLHENMTLNNGFYLYANTDFTEIYDREARDADALEGVTADLIDIIIQRGLTRFKLRPDGKYTDPQGKEEDVYKVKQGLVSNLHDNSFEDYMNRIKKVPIVILPETPSKNQPVKKRVSTHLEIIQAAAHYLAIDPSQKNKKPLVIPVIRSRQSTLSSCGGACLHAVFRYYDINETEKEINKLCEMSRNGIEPEAIVNAAKEFGLSSKLITHCRVNTLKNLVKNGIPVIVAMVAWGKYGEKNYNTDEDGHYVVVIGFDKARVYIEDPAILHGRAFLDWFEFEQRWHDVDGKHIAIPIKDNQTKPSFKRENYKFFHID